MRQLSESRKYFQNQENGQDEEEPEGDGGAGGEEEGRHHEGNSSNGVVHYLPSRSIFEFDFKLPGEQKLLMIMN